MTDYLQEATPQQILEATALNHSCLFGQSEIIENGDAFRPSYYNWSSPHIRGTGVTVAFPRYNPDTISEDLDRFMHYCRKHGVEGASVWTLDETDSPILGPPLLARGFDWGWQPHWMALDLLKMNEVFLTPPELRVERVQDSAEWGRLAPEDLPYRDAEGSQAKAFENEPDRYFQFGAWLGEEPVGQTSLLITRGPLGVAGIYSVGVVPAARNQGVGKAVIREACRQARDLGCRYAILNAANVHVYRPLGFETMGFGQSWWIHRQQFEGPYPAPEQVAFVEAVGRGDLSALDGMKSAGTLPTDPDADTQCRLSPLQVAVKTGQSDSADWLIGNGATPDLVSLWDLGWKDRIPEWVGRRPELLNRRFGSWRMVPLHESAQRNEPELAQLLLNLGADPSIEDSQFNSTPQGWAQHLRHPEVVRVFERKG